MNSIEDQLGELFDQVLLPMAAQCQAEGRSPFPLRPDVSWLSYYVRRRHSMMAPGDFLTAACADGAEFGVRMAAHWQSLGRDALAAQAPRFAALAQPPLIPAAGDANLSPYVYAMF